MKKVLTTLLLTLLAGTLFAGETKVAVVISKTSYRIAESETGSAGKGAKVTVKANGKRHNRLVYVDASGNRMVKEIKALQNEKTIAL